jgi:Ser/Thr protein kinase RdoA (MazF antagonist)
MTIPLLAHTPRFSVEKAASLADELYGVKCAVSSLPSERDQNFLLTTEANEKFILKIANDLEDPALLAAQNDVLQHLSARFPFCQRPLASKQGRYLEEVTSTDGTTNLIRLNTYLPGVPLGEVATQSSELLHDFGLKLGLLDKALLDFDHPAVHRNFHWDLANAPLVVNDYVDLIADAPLREAVLRCTEGFVIDVSSSLAKLPRSVIHGDANNYNVLVNTDSASVVGFVDFGDMVHSYSVGDLAIALAYVVLDKTDPLSVAMKVVGGYAESRPLAELEIEVLWRLMLMRLCMSVCLAAYQRLQRPDNDYLEISQRAIRNSFARLMSIDLQNATNAFKNELKA